MAENHWEKQNFEATSDKLMKEVLQRVEWLYFEQKVKTWLVEAVKQELIEIGNLNSDAVRDLRLKDLSSLVEAITPSLSEKDANTLRGEIQSVVWDKLLWALDLIAQENWKVEDGEAPFYFEDGAIKFSKGWALDPDLLRPLSPKWEALTAEWAVKIIEKLTRLYNADKWEKRLQDAYYATHREQLPRQFNNYILRKAESVNFMDVSILADFIGLAAENNSFDSLRVLIEKNYALLSRYSEVIGSFRYEWIIQNMLNHKAPADLIQKMLIANPRFLVHAWRDYIPLYANIPEFVEKVPNLSRPVETLTGVVRNQEWNVTAYIEYSHTNFERSLNMIFTDYYGKESFDALMRTNWGKAFGTNDRHVTVADWTRVKYMLDHLQWSNFIRSINMPFVLALRSLAENKDYQEQLIDTLDWQNLAKVSGYTLSILMNELKSSLILQNRVLNKSLIEWEDLTVVLRSPNLTAEDQSRIVTNIWAVDMTWIELMFDDDRISPRTKHVFVQRFKQELENYWRVPEYTLSQYR